MSPHQTGKVSESSACHDHDHFVQFYESDAFLVESVVAFFKEGLDQGEAVIVIGTEGHRRAIAEGLVRQGTDLSAARTGGRFVSLDAAETLTRFMGDDAPDPHRLDETLVPVITAAQAAGTGVRIFGEMVALLWDAGNVSGAIKLEELWNQVGESYDFSLFCAYPLGLVSRSGGDEAFERVCATHTNVIPGETYSQSATQQERLRAVATLQQRSASREHQAEELLSQRAELQAMLDQAQELERVREESLAMIAHDLRSPMTVITGFAEMLKDNRTSIPDDSIDEFLALILSNASQVSKLVDDILLVSSIQSAKFTYNIKQLDLAELAYRAVAGVRQAHPDIRFEVRVRDALPAALGDENRQLQILNNLLSNAAKFSPAGGTVLTELKKTGAELVVGVHDSGPGIPNSERHKLWQRFSRLDHPSHANVKGTGLGLYISKSLAEGQGGRIWVDSEPGQGSCFSYTIPVA